MTQSNVNAAELNKVYVTTQINDSSVIALPAGAAITDVRCRAVKFDSNGAIVLAGAGDAPFGVGIITNNVDIAAGEFVDVQFKNIGLVYTGGSFSVGASLAVDANGCFVTASGTGAVAIALQASAGAGQYIRALLLCGAASAAAAAVAAAATDEG